LDAERALNIGILHDILDRDTIAAEALAFCRSLCELPPEPFGAGKLAIELVADLEKSQGRNVERLAVSSLFHGREYQETMLAMQQKLAAKKPNNPIRWRRNNAPLRSEIRHRDGRGFWNRSGNSNCLLPGRGLCCHCRHRRGTS
jgi:hypothetical protein